MLGIRKIRRAKGLTLEALADAAQTSASHISNIERGIKDPSLELLRAIAAALDVEPKSLYADEQEGPGFAEPELSAFDFTAAGNSLGSITVQQLAPDAKHPIAFRTLAGRPALGLAPGSLLIIDTARLPEPGERVVANVEVEPGGEVETVIGIYTGGTLIGPEIHIRGDDFFDLQRHSHTVYGPIVATYWSGALAKKLSMG